MGKHCCYGTCNSDSRYDHRPHMENVSFIKFPNPATQPEKCSRWVHACGRKQFGTKDVKRFTYICSKHFVGGNGPLEDSPDPLPATASDQKVKQFSKKRKLPTERINTPPTKKIKLGEVQSEGEHDINGMALPCEMVVVQAEQSHSSCKCQSIEKKEAATQTETTSTISTEVQTQYDKYFLGAKVENIILKNELKLSKGEQEVKTDDGVIKMTVILDLDSVKDDDKKMRFFTGLSFLQFTALFIFLGDAVNKLTYWDGSKTKSGSSEKNDAKTHRITSPKTELFICLVRLRRGYSIFSLSHFCNLSESTVRRIFTTWLQFLYCHFNDLRHMMFPERGVLKKYMPKSFRCFKNFRCSIDCTEFFVEMPRDFSHQGNLYSNYKHHCTFKCLIAVAPNGAATFISDLYEGAISDKDIFAKSGILDYINPGDLILADRGFTIQDLLNQKQADLNIPAFLKGRAKLTPREELLTRKIAKVRIHVERYNERLKKFRLISGRIPLAVSHLANQAVFVAGCLVNFQRPLAS